jgi:hypothetical protein
MRHDYALQLLIGLIALAARAHGAQETMLRLPAAETDRAAQVIPWRGPADMPEIRGLRDDRGRVLPVQKAADGQILVVVPWQKAGETMSLTLQRDEVKQPDAVTVRRADGELAVRVRGDTAFVYRMDREKLPRVDINPVLRRAGYIHPIYSPSGAMVTDDYPSNHAWHHGIWTPWVKTSFQGREPDFWNMEKKSGSHDFVALERTWDGPVQGGFVARHQMTDLSAPSPVAVLNETWEVSAYNHRSDEHPAWVFDLVTTQTCASADPLVLPKFHYGGFGFRGAAEWNGPGDAALFLTSDGVADRIKGNDTRGRWCYVGGKIGGKISGVLILGHPGNFRAPQPMRLHPSFPYMSFVPQSLGDFAIQPGTAYVTRFRFVVIDGPPNRAVFDAFWHGYARPATAALTTL